MVGLSQTIFPNVAIRVAQIEFEAKVVRGPNVKWILLVLLMLVVAGAAFFLIGEERRAAVLGSEGYIQSGEKFGVVVGMDRTQAVRLVEDRGYERVAPTEDKVCNGRRYSEVEDLDVLFNEKANGVICLASQDARITSIGWGIGGWQF